MNFRIAEVLCIYFCISTMIVIYTVKANYSPLMRGFVPCLSGLGDKTAFVVRNVLITYSNVERHIFDLSHNDLRNVCWLETNIQVVSKRKLSMNGWDTKEGIKNIKIVKNRNQKPLGTQENTQQEWIFNRMMPLYNLISRI